MTHVVQIVHLAICPEVVPTLASWVADEWGAVLPGVTFADLVTRFEAATIPGRIPETFVAQEGDRPIGMASIVTQDMATRPDLSPWLASVYVIPEARRRGVGTALVRRTTEAMTELGIDRLYLFTPDQVPFYRRLGWEPLKLTRYRGENVQIMVYDVI
jgi:GNAT superfamily N-acetyltransferase